MFLKDRLPPNAGSMHQCRDERIVAPDPPLAAEAALCLIEAVPVPDPTGERRNSRALDREIPSAFTKSVIRL